MAKIRIKWIKSDIGYAGDQKRTLKALGFHRLNEVVEKEDTPVIRWYTTQLQIRLES